MPAGYPDSILSGRIKKPQHRAIKPRPQRLVLAAAASLIQPSGPQASLFASPTITLRTIDTVTYPQRFPSFQSVRTLRSTINTLQQRKPAVVPNPSTNALGKATFIDLGMRFVLTPRNTHDPSNEQCGPVLVQIGLPYADTPSKMHWLHLVNFSVSQEGAKLSWEAWSFTLLAPPKASLITALKQTLTQVGKNSNGIEVEYKEMIVRASAFCTKESNCHVKDPKGELIENNPKPSTIVKDGNVSYSLVNKHTKVFLQDIEPQKPHTNGGRAPSASSKSSQAGPWPMPLRQNQMGGVAGSAVPSNAVQQPGNTPTVTMPVPSPPSQAKAILLPISKLRHPQRFIDNASHARPCLLSYMKDTPELQADQIKNGLAVEEQGSAKDMVMRFVCTPSTTPALDKGQYRVAQIGLTSAKGKMYWYHCVHFAPMTTGSLIRWEVFSLCPNQLQLSPRLISYLDQATRKITNDINGNNVQYKEVNVRVCAFHTRESNCAVEDPVGAVANSQKNNSNVNTTSVGDVTCTQVDIHYKWFFKSIDLVPSN